MCCVDTLLRQTYLEEDVGFQYWSHPASCRYVQLTVFEALDSHSRNSHRLLYHFTSTYYLSLFYIMSERNTFLLLYAQHEMNKALKTFMTSFFSLAKVPTPCGKPQPCVCNTVCVLMS